MSFLRAIPTAAGMRITQTASNMRARCAGTAAVAAVASPLAGASAMRALCTRSAAAAASPLAGASLMRTTRMQRPAMPRVHLAANYLRRFSSAAAAAAPASASAPAFASASGAVVSDREISIMAHYVGADAFSAVTIPAQLAARAWRFTQPSSLLIPLDNLIETPDGAAAPVGPSTLSALFSLPPIPVAPIVRIPSESSMPASVAAALPSSGSLAFDPTSPYMVVFEYGAVVFFNTGDAVQREVLQKLASKDRAKLKDDYKIVLSGNTSEKGFSCRFLTDSMVLSSMDLNSVRIISQILSQTVALQHYEAESNRLLIKLRYMMRPDDLWKGVSTLGHTRSDLIINYMAESSTVMVDVLTELKLLDRSEIVWGHGEYDSLWQGLRREFDLSDRFDILQTKLDLLRDSHPFFLQVIHALQGHRMEIIIIALIAIEVVLGLLELYHRYA